MCFKRDDGLRAQNYVTLSRLNSQHNFLLFCWGGDMTTIQRGHEPLLCLMNKILHVISMSYEAFGYGHDLDLSTISYESRGSYRRRSGLAGGKKGK